MKKIKISYIGGGSRLWARKLMSDLALDSDLKGEVSLYDIVPEAARNNAVIGNKIMALNEANHGFTFFASDSLEASLKDCDFVFISILPGTFKEMEKYVNIPEKYGIYQPVGDTAGVAGIFRSLIMMPMYGVIAEAIKKYAPNAWVINFTNPMSMAVKTLYHVYPNIKAFGNCHEVFGTQKFLIKVLREELGIEAKRENIDINPQGINHFTWLNKASYKDIDIYPLYKSFVKKYKETGYIDEEYHKSGYFGSSEKAKMHLFDEFGVIAAAGDRHLVEFFPNEKFLGNPNTKTLWGVSLTPVQYRIERMEIDDQEAKDIVANIKEVDIMPSGEEGVRQIRALLGLEKFITNVNMPNIGQILNLPKGSIVETNAYFWKDSVQPVLSGEMPEKIVSLTMPHIVTHNLLIEAFANKDLTYAYEAFLQDVTVSRLSIEKKNQLFMEIYEAIDHYLGYYKEFKI